MFSGTFEFAVMLFLVATMAQMVCFGIVVDFFDMPERETKTFCPIVRLVIVLSFCGQIVSFILLTIWGLVGKRSLKNAPQPPEEQPE